MTLMFFKREFSLCVLLLAFFQGCAGPSNRSKPVDTKDSQQLEAIKARLKKGKKEPALQSLKTFVHENPSSPLVQEAELLIGDTHFQRGEFDRAYQSYMRVAGQSDPNPQKGEAKLRAARSLLQMNRPQEALQLIQGVLQDPNRTGENEINAHRIQYLVHAKNDDVISSLEALSNIIKKTPQAADQKTYRTKAREIIDKQLTEEEAKRLTQDPRLDAIFGELYFRLGQIAYQKGELASAKDHYAAAERTTSDPELKQAASSSFEQLDQRDQVSQHTVGVILPLTGKSAKVGYKMLRGIQLGLGIYGPNRSNLKLAVMDSQESPELAKRAVDRLVQEDKVIAIIGSLLSKTAPAVAQRSQELGVPSISLSQKTGLTDIGPYVFRDALTSEMQVRKLVEFAINQKKFTRFAILYPNDPYGIEYTNLFWDEVLARGGKIVGAQSYDPEETDFRAPIQKLIGTYYTDDRWSEYTLHLKSWQSQQRNRGERREAPQDLLPPITDFQALFIPDSVKAVGQIAPMLAYNDVSSVTLLGPNLWNTSNLIKRAGRHAEGALFVDHSWSSEDISKLPISQTFQRVFSETPDLFEIQGYDAATILRQILSTGVDTRSEVQKRLSSLTQFPGALGALSMSPRREILHPLEIFNVEGGVIKKVTDLPAGP